MAKHVFFDTAFMYNKNPKEALLAPFNLDIILDVDTNEPYFNSTLYKTSIPVSSQKGINYMGIIEKAITRAAMPLVTPDLKGFGGYGLDDSGDFYADYYDGTQVEFNTKIKSGTLDFSKARHIIVKIDGKTKAMSGMVVDEYGAATKYRVQTRNTTGDTGRHSPAAAMFALLAYCVNCPEVSNSVTRTMEKHFSDIYEGMNTVDFKTFAKGMRALDVDFYTLIAYPDKVKGAHGSDLPFDPEDYNTDEIPMLVIPDDLHFVSFVGDSTVLKGAKVKAKATKIKGKRKEKTIKELDDDKTYHLGITLTKDEEDLIPKGFDAFIPSEIILDVANEVKVSSFDPVPARNFLFTGETGTGKTTESQMLAKLLHMPYRSMNLSSDKLSSDILVSCLPNNKKISKEEISEIMMKWPSAEEIAINPAYCFEKLTGVEKEDADEKDIVNAESKILCDLLEKSNDFMYVDSPFVETFRKGGVIELQEANSCKAAILKSLNEALDDLNVIHLPTGEVVHRNPNCIVVVTANVGTGYEGINAFSNDFIARFHQADVFELPDDDTLANRVMARSGYEEKDVVKKMITVMKGIQKTLLEARGDSGSCSPRGLIAWARKTKNCGDPYAAGLKTIVGLATQDPEIRIQLISALETQFAPAL